MVTGKQFGLKKAERLSSKKTIEKVFTGGDSILQYPLKMVFVKTELPNNCPVQTAFSASKRAFKHAVKRNRIKRLMREAFRLNKHMLYREDSAEQLAVFIIYIGKELHDFNTIQSSMQKGLKKILKKISVHEHED